jgi:hypothetical protein
MKRTKHSRQILKGFNVLSNTLWISVLVSAIFLFLHVKTFAQQIEEKDYRITLQSRTFIPQEGIEKQTLSRLNVKIKQERQNPHVIMQFNNPPSRRQREELKIRGIRLLSFIGGNAWYVSISDTRALYFSDRSMLAKYPAFRQIRWIGEIFPQDKIETKIQETGFGSYAKNPDGTVKIIVKFFKDVAEQNARTTLEKYGSITQGPGMLNDWEISLPEGDLLKIAAEDGVQYIEEAAIPETVNNNCSRISANVNIVQAAPYNLDGNNIQVGEWDGGEIGAHNDLAGRLTIQETWTISDHATHVAGTLAGDGSESAGSGGAANQWRGVATDAEMFSYTFLGGDQEPEEHDDAINNPNVVIDLSQNSWGLNLGINHANHGNYRLRTSKYDSVVTGIYGRRIPIVFSAGNNQQRIQDALGNVIGYGSITPPGGTAKNVITVGAINCNNNSMTNFSSWGPTDDGRIKPDVVAPGGETGNAGVISIIAENHDEDNRNNATGALPADGVDDYFFPYSNDDAGNNEPEAVGTNAAPEGVWEGTSMAAPVVSGTIALMIQEYRETFFGNDNVDDVPLPSTLKALLIQGAQDLGNPGPDYQFGYGLINAQASVDMIRDSLMLESQFAEDNEEDIFLCNIPAGQANFRVTLVWDDVSANAGANPTIVNDLDLELEDPNGATYQPWILNAANPANNATTGADHINNVEQVEDDNPAQGLWKIKVTGFDINEPVQKYSLVSDFPFYRAENVSVVQVIDRTGSMNHREDPALPTYMESAKTAAQNFIGLMQLGDEVGVVSFDDPDCDYQNGTAEARFNLAEITTEAIRNNAITSVDGLNPRGCTSIGAGLKLAQFGPNFLNTASPDNPHAIVLLSDGHENTTPFVDSVLPLPDKTDVYTIALGPWADDELLRDIADQTGGKYYESPTILGLLSIYYQIQGEVELGEVADLALGSKSSGNDTRKVLIDAGASQTTFVVGWLQNQGRLNITLKDPNGISVGSGQSGVHKGGGNTYSYWKIENPVPGEWEVHIVREDAGAFLVDYTFAAFVKDVSKAWSFIPTIEYAGNCLLTKVYLFDDQNLQPITGATVQAVLASPKKSVYTLHYDYVKPTTFQWQPGTIFSPHLIAATDVTATVSSDRLPTYATTLNRYNLENIKKTGQSIFQYNTRTYTLYDDGTHGDEVVADGYYTYCIPNTDIAGSYNISFKISGVSMSGSKFSRSMLATATVRPARVDPVKVMVRIDPQVIPLAEGSEGIISVVPIDGFGNLLGPGHASRISISTGAGELIGDVMDNGDGFYFKKIISTGKEQSGKIIVKVNNITATSQPGFSIGPTFKKYGISVHSGTAVPTGTFANDFDPGINTILDIGYCFTPQLSLVGYFGYNDFKSKTTGIDDNYWINLSLNLKYRRPLPLLPTSALYYYIQAGPGYYIPKTGDSGLGANFGAGFNYDFSSSLTFEVGTDYHTVFDEDVKFWHAHTGIIIRF